MKFFFTFILGNLRIDKTGFYWWTLKHAAKKPEVQWHQWVKIEFDPMLVAIFIEVVIIITSIIIISRLK